MKITLQEREAYRGSSFFAKGHKEHFCLFVVRILMNSQTDLCSPTANDYRFTLMLISFCVINAKCSLGKSSYVFDTHSYDSDSS